MTVDESVTRLQAIRDEIGRGSMLTIEFPDGSLIRDGVAIVDFFEARSGDPAKPPGPCQHIVSLLINVLGAEGLLRPAMHYRWDFNEEDDEVPETIIELLRHFAIDFVPETTASRLGINTWLKESHVLDLRLNRKIGRANNLEVWLD
jgi:hypothetical protein